MRTLCFVVFLIATIGGFLGMLDTSDPEERQFEVIAMIIGAGGMAAMAWLRKLRVGSAQFKRELGPINLRELIVGGAWLVGLPVLAYFLVMHSLHVRTPGEQDLAVALGVAGLIGYVWYRNR